jgi:small subunit ribosomal protein S14
MVDKYKRHIFLKNEFKKLILKSIIHNDYCSLHRRYLANFYLTRLPKVSSKTYSHSRCSISGRSTGVNKRTNYSRFILRQEVYSSSLPGFRRASW